ncbi:MAG: hypothetical protein ACE5G9_00035 [Nitrospinales bacterium]
MNREKPPSRKGVWGSFSLRPWRLCGDFGMVNFNLQIAGFDMPKPVFTSRLKSSGYQENFDPVFAAFCREIR